MRGRCQPKKQPTANAAGTRVVDEKARRVEGPYRLDGIACIFVVERIARPDVHVGAEPLQALGMSMISPTTISLPFKLLLFVMLDGWTRLVHGLVLSYR